VAPGVTIMPIKQTDTEQEQSGGADRIAKGIDDAVRAGAKVINISVTTNAQGTSLRAAVAAAARAGVVIVAAAGNDTNPTGAAQPVYPASYSTSFPNVIAVSATTSTDQFAQFSLAGHYVTLAAPGAGVEVPAPLGGFTLQNGTSFATPFVTGTVALLLATHRGMSPGQVRDRLEATADPPPAAVPDARYGYGIVNPYLALTSLRADSAAPAKAEAAKPLPAPLPPKPVDRHLAHVALAVGLGLLGVAVLAAVAAAVVRSDRRRAPAALN
jgi:subtilisin family serine protease